MNVPRPRTGLTCCVSYFDSVSWMKDLCGPLSWLGNCVTTFHETDSGMGPLRSTLRDLDSVILPLVSAVILSHKTFFTRRRHHHHHHYRLFGICTVDIASLKCIQVTEMCLLHMEHCCIEGKVSRVL